jgi:hypothetical protein
MHIRQDIKFISARKCLSTPFPKLICVTKHLLSFSPVPIRKTCVCSAKLFAIHTSPLPVYKQRKRWLTLSCWASARAFSICFTQRRSLCRRSSQGHSVVISSAILWGRVFYINTHTIIVYARSSMHWSNINLEQTLERTPAPSGLNLFCAANGQLYFRHSLSIPVRGD